MPFDEQNFEYIKNDHSLKRELIADSRNKIIRQSNVNNKFHKPLGFLLIAATLFFLILQMGIITPMTIMQ